MLHNSTPNRSRQSKFAEERPHDVARASLELLVAESKHRPRVLLRQSPWLTTFRATNRPITAVGRRDISEGFHPEFPPCRGRRSQERLPWPSRQLTVAGYRSLRELAIPLWQVNLVEGPNGCGKSNLYQSMFLLAEAAHGWLTPPLARKGGMPSYCGWESRCVPRCA